MTSLEQAAANAQPGLNALGAAYASAAREAVGTFATAIRREADRSPEFARLWRLNNAMR